MRFTLGSHHLTSLIGLIHAATAFAAACKGDGRDVEIITRDVCVVGGGSSGTYAAVQLKDQGKTVVVVERSDHLGGHAETSYFDNGKHMEYGVMGVFNDKVSREYFKKLGAASEPLFPATLKKDYIDFKTGHRQSPNTSYIASLEAVIRYRIIIQKYSYLQKGVYDLPWPIPEELLLPFREFVQEHDLGAALGLIQTFASSVGDLLETPLLYVLQVFGVAHVNALFAGYIVPVEGFTKFYGRAVAAIGSSNIFFNSTVVESSRSNEDGVCVTVEDRATGKKTLVQAQKLLIAIPSTAEAMVPFDLDTTEKDVFDKWQWKSYYAGIVRANGIPGDLEIVNRDPTQPFDIPKPPYQWALQWMGVSNHLASKLVADANFTEQDAKELILSDLGRIGNAFADEIQNATLVAFADHTPTTLHVPVEDVRNGFFDQIYRLQGRRNTFYTGRAVCSDYSSLLWAFTDTVLEQMFK